LRMADPIADRVVVVAGLASGLGEVIAERFAESGARLVLSDPTADVERIARQIREAHPGSDAIGEATDFTDLTSCQTLMSRAVARHGKLDVLVVAAVTLQKRGPLVSIDPDEWDRVMGVNVKGPFLLCRSAIPALTRPGGAIAFVGSFTAQTGMPNSCLYSASKAALHSLTRSLARELASEGIRVNTVAPGYLWSNVDQQGLEVLAAESGKSVDEVRALRNSTIPLGRQAEAREIAEAMFFISSPAASYMTGACVDVNGGLVMR
jgi:NAD(P)-dependent dehydrogenase (short-subunit alcohol dehydrogenase family)